MVKIFKASSFTNLVSFVSILNIASSSDLNISTLVCKDRTVFGHFPNKVVSQLDNDECVPNLSES